LASISTCHTPEAKLTCGCIGKWTSICCTEKLTHMLQFYLFLVDVTLGFKLFTAYYRWIGNSHQTLATKFSFPSSKIQNLSPLLKPLSHVNLYWTGAQCLWQTLEKRNRVSIYQPLLWNE
jgi:hypothetical protein